MQLRGNATHKRMAGRVVKALLLPAVLLAAIHPVHAQTPAPVESGPAAPAPEEPAPQAPAQSSTPDGFTIAGFTFRPGGRVKLDIIRDFDPIASEDSFDPRTIPVDESEGGNSSLHARETRLFLDM